LDFNLPLLLLRGLLFYAFWGFSILCDVLTLV